MTTENVAVLFTDMVGSTELSANVSGERGQTPSMVVKTPEIVNVFPGPTGLNSPDFLSAIAAPADSRGPSDRNCRSATIATVTEPLAI
jgi:hypothetical protein